LKSQGIQPLSSLTMAKTKKIDWQLAPARESKDHVRMA